MNNTNIRALQEFSDSLLAGQPDTIPAEAYPRIAECLACKAVDSLGASFAARVAIASKLRGLPSLTAEALGRLEGSFRNLLLAYLEHGFLLDEVIEILLTKLRRAVFLEVLSGTPIDAFGLDLISALGIFCFDNEYVFAEGEMESRALAILERSPSPAAIAMLACYRPLTQFSHLAFVWEKHPSQGVFARLITVQVTEPLQERAIAPEIPSLSQIENTTSLKVREMYEESPYPRWRALPPVRGTATFEPRSAILVAGCGTGRHAILSARAHPGARVLAIDLSRASLAYGVRKVKEGGFSNIEFCHADILELPATGLRFDLISSIGVLHHMESPQAGLNALTSVMTDNGIIELGLYTESGRIEVVEAIALRQQMSIPATSAGIRQLRQIIFALPQNHKAKFATESLDFYSMSGCRDYLFHVMEHRLTLKQVDEMLRAAGLRLVKIASKKGYGQFQERFSDVTDLLQWHEFEMQNPGCFGSMYEMRVARV